MNPNIMECDDHKLKLLLAADEQAVEHDPWMQHVEHCSHCQSRLRELAAQADDWQKAAEVLAADDDDVPYFGRDHDVPSSWNESMVKQLLEPPSHPEMLGRLGRYEMERMIGCGGMGIVFKAFDTELNRVVAVKLLAPYLAARGSARKRFAREARAAAGVRDDHVVPIFNVESEHEPPFLVMQYVAGGSLQEKLDRDGPLEVAEVLRIGLQTAKGLAAAHAQGLIHRDVKPSNILLDEGVERALLTDFGLARAEDDACLTRSGFHPGTPHYMSPEQVRGEAIDGRSDLFSLGCVLYALCTGHSPFRAETSYAVMRRITDESPRAIRGQNANIPEWLEAIVMKLLSKSREDRFASAKEVAELLEDCLAHVHQPATTPLPVGIQALAAQSVSASTESLQANRLKARHQRIPPIGKFIAAAAGALFLLFAGVLIILELNKGTLTIVSEVADVPIRIMQGEDVVKQLTVSKQGATTRLRAGKYTIEVDDESAAYEILGDRVTLKQGEATLVTISLSNEKKLARGKESRLIQRLQGQWRVVRVVDPEGADFEPQKRSGWTFEGHKMTSFEFGSNVVFEVGFRLDENQSPAYFDMLTSAESNSDQLGLIEVEGNRLKWVHSGNTGGKSNPIRPTKLQPALGLHYVEMERVVTESTALDPNSQNHVPTSKPSPEYPSVKIVVHDEESKPLEGVKVSLIQLAKDQGGQVLEINETSNANGLAVNRYLPYGHYELTATTADGWYLTGLRSRLNVEFEKGVDAILVAPTPGKTSKLVISSGIETSAKKISGLRFGGLTDGRWTEHAPEPEGRDPDKEQEFSSFPTITNGIEYVGAEIRIEIWRSISQPAPSMQQMNTRWYWSRPPNSKVSTRYLIANGQARSFDQFDEKGYTARDVSLKLPPVEGSEFFKLPGLNYQVGATLLKPRETTPLPLELDIPAGDVRVKIGSFFGKPSAAVMAALKWQPREQQPEFWLQAYLAPDSAWVERLINTDWINSPFRSGGSVGFTALWRDQTLQPGERLEIPLGMTHPPENVQRQTKNTSIVGHWKVAKLAHLPANELEGATVVIDKGTIKMHVPSQKGPHPHWRYTTGADGEIDLNEFDDAKGDTTSYAKFLLEGKTLYLAVNAKKGDYPRPESARGEPQDGVLYIVLELDELASSPRTVSATDRGDEKLDGKPEVPEQPQLGKTLQQLQGKWRLSRQITEDGDEGMPSQSVWEFKGDRVIVQDSGPGGAMLIEVDDSQSPVHVKMTIEIDEESGLGLLSLEGDKVILCLGKRQKTPDPHSRPEKLQWVAGVFYMELIRMKPGETVVPSKPSMVLPMDESAISPLSVAPSERHALSIDHGNARSVVEAYVASALAKNIGNAVSLAKNSPAAPKRIRELPEFLNVQRLKIETVYINDPSKPTKALATSVAVKLGEEHKNSDGRRDGFMVLTLEFTDDKWFVIDIDFETESGAEKELNEFLKANPKSIGIPPQS